MDEQRLVVRLHDPRRFRVVLLAGVALVLLLCFGLFELGQRVGGYSSFRSDDRRQALRAEAKQLRLESQQLKDTIARLQTSLEVDREAQLRLTATLAESEARIAELHEELEFYRRIVAPPDGQTGLRVQTFEVLGNGVDNGYRLRLLLVQSPQRSGRAQGQVDLSLRGTLDGEEASLTLQQLASEPQGFDFLYFQDVDLEVMLPEGFTPEAAEIELRPEKRNARTVVASFPWQPRG